MPVETSFCTAERLLVLSLDAITLSHSKNKRKRNNAEKKIQKRLLLPPTEYLSPELWTLRAVGGTISDLRTASTIALLARKLVKLTALLLHYRKQNGTVFRVPVCHRVRRARMCFRVQNVHEDG